MVYCGKPSGGCHACRERKTKCDQVPEGCTQCKRAKRICPGYRVAGDLIFRDQSSTVIRKFKAKEAREKQKNESRGPTLVTSPDDEVEMVERADAQMSAFSLAPTIEDRGTGFFVANYVLGMDGPSKGHLDYLVDMARGQTLDDGLLSSMKAVGLAGYAHAMHAPSLMKNARYQYVRALQSINKALRDPVGVKKDSTLLSIMILGIFETTTGTNRGSLKDWAEHINGAAAVIKLRGPTQIERPAGRRMLVQVAANQMIFCLQRGVSLPDHMKEYMSSAIKFVGNPDPAFTVNDTMMHFTDLRASIVNKSLTDREEILSRALELDGVLLQISTNTPPGWEYEIIDTDPTSGIAFNGRYHIYYDYWIAQIWNALRSLRIMLNEMIRDVLLEGFTMKPPLFNRSEHTAQFQISTDTLYDLQLDILYSVPQHINTFPPPSSCPSSPLSDSSIPQLAFQGHTSSLRMSGGAFLIWPLWFAGIMDIATDEVRVFVVRNLRGISENMGVRQAAVLADLVEKKLSIGVWREEDGNNVENGQAVSEGNFGGGHRLDNMLGREPVRTG
jgi:hypothetical protein